MCSRCSACVQLASDLTEAFGGGTFGADALHDLAGKRPWTAAHRGLPSPPGSPALSEQPLELVDGDQLRSPGQLDRLDERQKPGESRAADPERLGGLTAGIREPLDPARLADGWSWVSGSSRRGLGVALQLLPPALTARHPYSVQKW